MVDVVYDQLRITTSDRIVSKVSVIRSGTIKVVELTIGE